jgi:glycosyltransferase involved in cell wall biosynthesis
MSDHLQPAPTAAANDPTVTVIVPAYNAAWSIESTLKSIKAQLFANFECVVVDDGSTDDTAERVERFIADDPRFRLIRQANGGVSAARNRALAEARGRYVANLDSDDMWRPQFLLRAVEILEHETPAPVMVFSRSLWIHADETPVGGERRTEFGKIDFRTMLLANPIGNGSATLMRRDALAACGGWDVDLVRNFGQTEDWLLQLQLAAKGPVAAIDDHLVLYRVSENSASASLERSARATIETVRRVRRMEPRLPAVDYWMARSHALLWLLQRARKMGRKELIPWLAREVYLRNPVWFLSPTLRASATGAATKRLRGLMRAAAGRAAAPKPAA